MKCPNCQVEIRKDDAFCPNCGYNLEDNLKNVHTGNTPISQTSSYENRSEEQYLDVLAGWMYGLSFIFFPIGIWIWAFYRQDKPTATNKILLSTILGFFFWVILIS